MTTAQSLIQAIEANMGQIYAEDGALVVRPRKAAAPVLDDLLLHKAEVVAELEHRRDRLRPVFVCWFDTRIRLDARSVALRLPSQWSTSVSALAHDCARWMVDHSQVVPPTSDEFKLLLQELGCAFQTIAGEQFILNIGLREDVQAHELFQRQPLPEPGERDPGDPGEAALERVPVPILVPATTPDGTPLPPGCRVISWQLREAPIRLTSSTVTNVPRFVNTTLQQLAAELKGQHWLGGHWGGVPGLLDRLRAVGVVIEVDQPPRPKGGAR